MVSYEALVTNGSLALMYVSRAYCTWAHVFSLLSVGVKVAVMGSRGGGQCSCGFGLGGGAVRIYCPVHSAKCSNLE